jgi:hypothetical protein
MSKTDTQSYMVVRVNDKTGERIDMLGTPVSHKEAVTIKSKLMSPLPKHLRTVLEPRGSQEKIAIQLEPELEQMFQECQRELDAARSGRYNPEERNQIMCRHVLGDDIYARQVRMPKWSKTVSMLEEPKVAIRHVFDWGIPTSKSAHAQKTDFFHDLAVKMGDEWDATVNLAVEAYGSQDSLISGVYRDHFPDDVKQRLRFLNSAKNLASDAARLHEYLSTTRSPLFK